MKTERAPRTKKRLACELTIGGDRYKGIALDISVSGIFVQTNARLTPGTAVDVRLTLPGTANSVAVEARVARTKVVPTQLLAVARGGVGLSIERAPQAYLDFVAGVSPEQAEFMASSAGIAASKPRVGHGSRVPRAGGSGAAGSGRESAPAQKRFRIHAVDSKSGQKNTFLAVSESEEKASAKVVEELGEDWQVLFIERA